jgi:hypothetical protein
MAAWHEPQTLIPMQCSLCAPLGSPQRIGRVVIVCRPPIYVGRMSWRDALPDIEAALTVAADRADALCDSR